MRFLLSFNKEVLEDALPKVDGDISTCQNGISTRQPSRCGLAHLFLLSNRTQLSTVEAQDYAIPLHCYWLAFNLLSNHDA